MSNFFYFLEHSLQTDGITDNTVITNIEANRKPSGLSTKRPEQVSHKVFEHLSTHNSGTQVQSTVKRLVKSQPTPNKHKIIVIAPINIPKTVEIYLSKAFSFLIENFSLSFF